jgi:hypothetical protein
MSPITVMPGSVSAYTVIASNNTRVSGPGKDGSNNSSDGALTSQKSNQGFANSNNCRGNKRDPSTPDTAEGKSSTRQRQKKARHVMKADTAAKEKKDLGMFYLKNPGINPSDVFPKDMPEKVCANFTCKGKECINANCNFTHPRKASELKRKTILTIASHFDKKDIGWFNEYHFMKMPGITNDVKRLLGNAKGTISKTG